jgi:hypothetical protein
LSFDILLAARAIASKRFRKVSSSSGAVTWKSFFCDFSVRWPHWFKVAANLESNSSQT